MVVEDLLSSYIKTFSRYLYYLWDQSLQLELEDAKNLTSLSHFCLCVSVVIKLILVPSFGVNFVYMMYTYITNRKILISFKTHTIPQRMQA